MEETVALAKASSVDLLALDEALEKLGHLDSRKSGIIELRFFGSLTIEETAEALDISPSTISTEWHAARAWLRKELGEP
jgi:RNA polymerase sigma factor (sigma-70 family)